MAPTSPQKLQREIMAKAIVPKITAFLSLAASIFIIQDILRSKTRRRRVYHRLLIGMSTCESITSICTVIGSWAMPRGTLHFYGAMGNIQTCSAQGTFFAFGAVGTPLYNATLCMYYLLVIRYGWSEQRILSVEKYFHTFPIVISTFMAIVGLPFKAYNPSLWLCWYAPYPITCVTTGGCQRGQFAAVFRWLHYSLVWSSIAFVTLGMFMIWKKVITEEQATAKFRNHGNRRGGSLPPRANPGAGPGAAPMQAAASSKSIVVAACNDLHAGANSSGTLRQQQQRQQQQPGTPTRISGTLSLAPEPRRRRSNSSKVASQAFLFVLAMYFSWVFATLTSLTQIITGKVFFSMLILTAITYPSQGYFNVLVYLRPRYVRYRRLNPSAPYRKACWSVIALDPEDGESDNVNSATRSTRLRSSTGSVKATVAAAVEEMRRRSTLGSEPGRRCSFGDEDRRRSSTGSIPMLDDAINENFEDLTRVHFKTPALNNEGEDGSGGIEGTTSNCEQRDLPSNKNDGVQCGEDTIGSSAEVAVLENGSGGIEGTTSNCEQRDLRAQETNGSSAEIAEVENDSGDFKRDYIKQ